MTDQTFEVLVIGGGPGGYTAAIRAAQLGYTVALIEKAELGGVCLNWGCIPTKSLLHAADLLRDIRSASELGIKVAEPEVDLDKVVARSRQVAGQLNSGVHHLMRKNGIEVICGEAVLLDKGPLGKHPVRIGEVTVIADNIVLATGARPRNLPNIQVDTIRVWDAKTAMNPPFKPKRLLVIGAGAIGVEFASFYNTLGTHVTIVEMLDQVLPVEDVEIAAIAGKTFKQQGIDILLGVKVDSLVVGESNIRAMISGSEYQFDAAILSVGVTGNIESLGLEVLGIDTDGGFIQVDHKTETSVKAIYAIGDVTGAPCLAHKATHEALLCIDAIAGGQMSFSKPEHIPACTYSYPQVASIGLTELAAKERGPVRTGRFPLLANGKAIAVNETAGMVKTIFDQRTGELLGAHMVGPGVTEMIHGFAIAMGLETTEAELINTIFPHPTISEAMHESVLSAFDRAINF